MIKKSRFNNGLHFVLASVGLVFVPGALAQIAEEKPITLPAQPLQQSLVELGTAFGVTIVSRGDLTEDKEGPAVSGRYTLDEALVILLQENGLETRRSNTGTLVVEPRGAESDGVEVSEQKVIEQVVVYGQQIDRSLQDTKESAAVFRREDFEVRSLLEIEDVLLQAANVAITSGGTFNTSIRGISRLSFASGGTGDLGTTFYDDVAITGNAVTFISPNLWDVQQIEILRGPQSTNVGRNALSGATIIRTVEPQLDEFEAALRLEAGNFDTRAFEGMANVPITENSALRLAAEQSETQGFVDNTTTGADDDGRSEFSTVRARYLLEPSDSFRAIASLQYVDGERGDSTYITEPGNPQDTFETTSNDPNVFSFEGSTGSINLQWSVSDQWTLQSITAFSDGSYDRVTDNDLSEVNGGNVLNPVSQFNVSQEFRAAFESESVRGVIGVYYLDDETDGAFISSAFIRPSLAGVPEFLLPFYPETFNASQESFSDGNSENFAIFTQWEKDFGDRLTLSAGLRFDHEKSTQATVRAIVVDDSTPLPDPVLAGEQAELIQPGSGALVQGGVTAVNVALNALLVPVNESFSNDFSAVLPELGVTYALTAEHSLSAFYKRGYRAGGARIENTGDLNEFDPEYLDNYELSFRSQWLDNKLIVNANAYYGIWTDQQLNVPINGNQFNTRTENAGESTIWGFEFETSYAVSDRTQLFANIGYAFTEFDDFCSISSIEPTLPDCEVDGVIGRDIAGNEFALASDWTVAIGGEHFFTEHWYVQANATYQGPQFSDVENRDRLATDEIFLINASMGYRADSFDVRLYGRNLTDEFYVLNRFEDAATGGIGVTPGTPREFGIIFSKSFY
ncbi:MAG: TonB-dependent receptor [Pseudomonadota bacterium]